VDVVNVEVDKVRRQYAECHTYQDHGIVVSDLAPDLPSLEYSFKTLFKKPSFFAFQITEKKSFISAEDSRFFVGSDGKSAVFIRKIGIQKEEIEISSNLSQFLARAIGISCGVINCIPTLLLPNLKTRNLFEYARIRMLPENEIINFKNCIRLEGFFPDNIKDIIYIATPESHITKISKGSSSGFDHIYYKEISFNKEIPDSIFEIPEKPSTLLHSKNW